MQQNEEKKEVQKPELKKTRKRKTSVTEIPVETTSDFFTECKNPDVLAKEFKLKAAIEIEQKKWGFLRVDFKTLEKFFGIIIDAKSTHKNNWIPRAYRDALVKEGVHIFKKRGRTYATVTVEGIGILAPKKARVVEPFPDEI